jgi:hypothetical protein
MNRYAYNQDWYAIKYGLAALDANHWARMRRQNADRLDGSEPSEESLAEVEQLRGSAFEYATEAPLFVAGLAIWKRAPPGG